MANGCAIFSLISDKLVEIFVYLFYCTNMIFSLYLSSLGHLEVEFEYDVILSRNKQLTFFFFLHVKFHFHTKISINELGEVEVPMRDVWLKDIYNFLPHNHLKLLSLYTCNGLALATRLVSIVHKQNSGLVILT